MFKEHQTEVEHSDDPSHFIYAKLLDKLVESRPPSGGYGSFDEWEAYFTAKGWQRGADAINSRLRGMWIAPKKNVSIFVVASISGGNDNKPYTRLYMHININQHKDLTPIWTRVSSRVDYKNE